MKKIFTAAVAAILTFSISMNATTPETPSMTRVAVETTAGNFMIGLYNDTPRHRDNFLKLVGDGFYIRPPAANSQNDRIKSDFSASGLSSSL